VRRRLRIEAVPQRLWAGMHRVVLRRGRDDGVIQVVTLPSPPASSARRDRRCGCRAAAPDP
jgi:hypothetical protein